MTTLDTYATFLTARWDEIEQVALEVQREKARITFTDPADKEPSHEVYADVDAGVPHVAIGDAAVLADIAAKRAMLEDARTAWLRAEPDDTSSRFRAVAQEMLRVLINLAAPFRDHPDHPAHSG